MCDFKGRTLANLQDGCQVCEIDKNVFYDACIFTCHHLITCSELSEGAGGVLPPQGGVLPLLGGVIPPKGGVLPPLGGVIPPKGDVLPPLGAVLSPKGVALPPQGVVLPLHGHRD